MAWRARFPKDFPLPLPAYSRDGGNGRASSGCHRPCGERSEAKTGRRDLGRLIPREPLSRSARSRGASPSTLRVSDGMLTKIEEARR
jgi:hypothetical protein